MRPCVVGGHNSYNIGYKYKNRIMGKKIYGFILFVYLCIAVSAGEFRKGRESNTINIITINTSRVINRFEQNPIGLNLNYFIDNDKRQSVVASASENDYVKAVTDYDCESEVISPIIIYFLFRLTRKQSPVCLVREKALLWGVKPFLRIMNRPLSSNR